MDNENINKSNKKLLIIAVILIVVIIALATVAVWAIFFRQHEKPVVLTPDYAPKALEDNAEPIPDNGEDKLEQPDGGGGVGIEYTKDVTIDLSNKTAELYFDISKQA